MNKIKNLEKELESVRKEYKEFFNETFGKTSDFEEYEKLITPYWDKINNIELEIRLLQKSKLDNLSEYGSHITIKDFIEMCQNGYLMDYDGHGYYATDSLESNILIYPSDVTNNKIRKDFSHVIWFNK